MAEAVFFGSVLLVVYAYIGYPAILAVLALFRRREVRKGDVGESVSLIITAHNEEARIRAKLENSLAQEFPKDRLEILVASDCSTDGTDDIVRSFADRGVRLVRLSERKGKEAGQRLAIAEAKGDILVFSDVATSLEPSGVATIVRNFADPTVGCVSSVDRFVDARGTVSGEGFYVRYEMFLRKLETRVGTLVGLSGSFFAARRSVCEPWATDLPSDFNTLLNAVRKGLRGVSDPESVGYYPGLASERREFERKVRTVLRGIAVLGRSTRMLNPFRYGLFAWQLASHKLCRWLVPFAMLGAFVSSAVLASRSPAFAAVLAGQVLVYAVALYGIFGWPGSKQLLVKLPSFLVLVNASILVAWYRYLRGERMVTWQPSRR